MKEDALIALVGGKVYTMAGPVYERGMVLIAGRKIAAVAPEPAPPPGARVVDVSGKHVLPGLVDAHTHLGVREEVYRVEGDDLNETSDPVTPHLRAIDAVSFADVGFRDAVAGGVTTVLTGPGSANVIGGLALVLKTHAPSLEEAVLKEPAGLKIALGENPKRVYGEQQRKAPVTRMATAALIREAFVAAQNYARKLQEGERDPAKAPDRDLKLEALLLALERKVPVLAHAHREDDILTALRIAAEFGFELVLQHATEGHKLAAELARRGVPAVVGPSFTTRAKVELKERTFATAGILARAGVRVALMSDHPVTPVQYLPLAAALAAREGMPEDEALKAITINPAVILGVADRVGSLEPGKDADVVVFSAHPFDWRARPELVLVDGTVAHAAGPYAGLAPRLP